VFGVVLGVVVFFFCSWFLFFVGGSSGCGLFVAVFFVCGLCVLLRFGGFGFFVLGRVLPPLSWLFVFVWL